MCVCVCDRKALFSGPLALLRDFPLVFFTFITIRAATRTNQAFIEDHSVLILIKLLLLQTLTLMASRYGE